MAVKDPEASSFGSFIVFITSLIYFAVILNRMKTRILLTLFLSTAAFSFGIQSTKSFAIEDEVGINELVRAQEQQSAAYNKLNQSNPLSSQYQQRPNNNVIGAAAISAPFNTLEKWLANPLIQSVLRFFANPALSTAITQIINSPNRSMILYTNLGWFVIFVVFRAWKLSHMASAHWVRALFFRFWSTLLFVIGAIIAIPSFYLGQPYIKVLGMLSKTVLKF